MRTKIKSADCVAFLTALAKKGIINSRVLRGEENEEMNYSLTLKGKYKRVDKGKWGEPKEYSKLTVFNSAGTSFKENNYRFVKYREFEFDSFNYDDEIRITVLERDNGELFLLNDGYG